MDPLRSEITDLLTHIPLDFGGGCSASKAYVMAHFIRDLRMQATLDIGVYRGRSLLPQALAHLRHSGGVAYGVDPWSKADARENDNLELKAQLDRFVETTDFEALHGQVDALRRRFGVERHCVLVRKRSADAAEDFRRAGMRFDLIHVDGNHDTAVVMKDVQDCLLLLKRGGILVMDDVSWRSVRPAYDDVASRTTKLFERTDALNDYAVFWNVALLTPVPERVRAVFRNEFVVSG
jgi:hypothetical protein